MVDYSNGGYHGGLQQWRTALQYTSTAVNIPIDITAGSSRDILDSSSWRLHWTSTPIHAASRLVLNSEPVGLIVDSSWLVHYLTVSALSYSRYYVQHTVVTVI